LKTALILSTSIESYQIIREIVKDLEGYLRIRASLIDGGQLDIFIYVISNHKISIKKYSFHWQDKDKKLVMRWDNAPHHPGLDNFPHHLHLEGETKPSTEPYFINILKKIEDEVEMD
jgi:hypothetical protein